MEQDQIKKVESFKERQSVKLQGTLPDQDGGQHVKILGNITAPGIWIHSKEKQSELDYVIFDKDDNSIVYVGAPERLFGVNVIGNLLESKVIEELGLNNSGKKRKPKELGDFLRQNLYLAEDRIAMLNVVNSLKKFSFKFKSEGESEKLNDGAIKAKFIQEVETSIDRVFKLKLAPYKGEEEIIIDVEIVVEADGRGVYLWLESLELMDAMNEMKDKIFQREEDKMTDFTVINY